VYYSRVYSIALPKTTEAQVIGKQLLGSIISEGRGHYRESVRARSGTKFISEIEGGLQELEESSYWLELLIEAGIISEMKLAKLVDEANQLTVILITCVKKPKQKKKVSIPPYVRIVVASNFQLEVSKNESKIYSII